MDAIVYTSNTGSTKRYAELLSQMTGLPAFALGDAKDKLSANAGIIYLGWIMASGVKGCLLYTSPSPRDVEESRMPSSA